MAGIADGLSPIGGPAPLSDSLYQPVTVDYGASSAGSGSSVSFGDVVDWATGLGNLGIGLANAFKKGDQITYIPIAALPTNFQSIVSQAGNVGSGSTVPIVNALDSYLANSRTLQAATSNLGTSVSSGIKDVINKYGAIILGVFGLAMVVWMMKSSGTSKRY